MVSGVFVSVSMEWIENADYLTEIQTKNAGIGDYPHGNCIMYKKLNQQSKWFKKKKKFFVTILNFTIYKKKKFFFFLGN